MSGHSKWSQIKRSKGAKDAKRGVLFARLSKKITMAAKKGGNPNPELNFQLRTEIENAKMAGLPNDNIDRAIKKAFDKSAADLKEVVYEGYGPAGSAFIIECVTDNSNRSVQNIKHIFSKAGGSLGAIGSVAWQFSPRGCLVLEKVDDIETMQMSLLEWGAFDITEEVDGVKVLVDISDVEKIKDLCLKYKYILLSCENIRVASQSILLEEEDQKKVEALMSALEEYEDVVSVYTNVIII